MADIRKSTAVCPECGNTLWDYGWNTIECTNCLYERPYNKRQRGTEQTPSQTKTVKRIIRWFEEYRCYGDKVVTTETKMLDYGSLSLSLHTSDNYLIDDGGHFIIGRRGGITVCSTYGVFTTDGETAKHYAKMLGGKVMD